MFTGLIREIAQIQSFDGRFLRLKALHRAGIGDSIAINGACLTVTKVLDSGFEVELSLETQKLLAMENLTGAVHIEPAMKLSDRVEGHLVQGHVDGSGTITAIRPLGESKDFHISANHDLLRYIVPKGSITIDGVSLTVNDVSEEDFRLTIIPHTFENTLLGTYQPGRKVNIETDMINRALAHLSSWNQKGDSSSKNYLNAALASY